MTRVLSNCQIEEKVTDIDSTKYEIAQHTLSKNRTLFCVITLGVYPMRHQEFGDFFCLFCRLAIENNGSCDMNIQGLAIEI